MDSIQKLQRIIEEFRRIDHTASTQALSIFLIVCEEEGLCLTEVGNRAVMNLSTLSRNAYVLSNLTYRRTPGMDLIVHRNDPTHWRQKLLYLTPKGRELRQRFREILES